MSLPHLGDQITALADGQLEGAARDNALGHVAVCALCRADVEQHRALKVRMRALVGPAVAPTPSSDLTTRLMALSTAPASAPLGRPGLPTRSLVAGAFALAALTGGATMAMRGTADGPGGGGGQLVNPTLYPVAQFERPGRETVLQDPSRLLVAAISRP